MRYSLIIYFLLWSVLECSEKVKPEKITTEKPPNIVFILADDLGWADLPTYGNKFNEAPNIEILASEGMTFNNAYAANPVCSPTRASIQTGLYPARIGMNDWIPGHWRPYEKVEAAINTVQELPLKYQTIGEVLEKVDYKTGYFGKWHLGPWEKKSLEDYGYENSVVWNGGGFFDYQDLMYPATNYPKGTVLSSALTNLSIDFIEKHRDRPFFLFLSHFDVHVQLDAQKELVEKYLKKPKAVNYPSNAVYAAMVENIDRSVGRINRKLKELNLDKNTIIVFFSDNGGLQTRYDNVPLLDANIAHVYENDSLQHIASSNKPLRGEKGTLFEGGIREPLIVKWPGIAKPNLKNTSLVSSVDFYPTFLKAAGVDMKAHGGIDGIDLLPQILNPKENLERTLFWHYPVYHHDVPASAIRQGDWKLIEYLDDNSIELYNLKNDIGETTDLSKQRLKLASQMLTTLKEWRNDVNAEMPTPNPNFDSDKRFQWGVHPDTKK